MSVWQILLLTAAALIVAAIIFGAGVAYGTWKSDEEHVLREADEITRRGYEI